MSSKNKNKSHTAVNGGQIHIGGNVSGSNIVIGDNNRINVERNADIKNSEIEIARQNKKMLIYYISQSLNSSEISKLSFELGIDYDKIETNSKSDTIDKLIEIIENQGIFSRLLQFLKSTRPDVFEIITTPTK